MKNNVKYQLLLISGKLRLFVSVKTDSKTSAEYHSIVNDIDFTNITLYPSLGISLIKTQEMDENGLKKKGLWNPNDTVQMNSDKYPFFLEELVKIQTSLKNPNMYTYVGKRLELNNELAEKARIVFDIPGVKIELVPVVIIQPDETQLEGIKMKFNNENSSVLLTLNELEVLRFKIKKIDIDILALMMYQYYIRLVKENSPLLTSPVIDIVPKNLDTYF